MAILAAINEEYVENRVVKTGYELAEAFDVPLYVLHVFPKNDFQAHQELMMETTKETSLAFENDADSAEAFAQHVIENSLGDYDEDRVVPIGRVGKPVIEIISSVNDHDPKFLVIGGRRRSPVGKAVFGDKTQALLLQAEVPVTTVLD